MRSLSGRSLMGQAKRWQKAVALGALVVCLGVPFRTIASLARQQGPQAPPPNQPEPPAAPTGKPQAPAPAQTGPAASISIESNLVNVDVVVTDQEGNVVGGLKRENFRVTDNGAPQQVTNFSPAESPITMVMLVEYSSAAYGYFGYKGADWARYFLEQMKPTDWLALKTFDLRTTLQVDFTHNAGEIDQALATLGFPTFHEAVLFDALFQTLDELRGVKGKKSILLMTTGFDTISHHRLDETYNLLKETDVTIFAVGTGEEIDLYSDGNIGYLQAKNQLTHFAEMTGGHAWFPRLSGELPDVFAAISAFLRNQYTVGFQPNTPADGHYHKLQVTIVDADGNPMLLNDKKGKKHKVVVYARPGYTAPKPGDIAPGN